MFSVLPALRRVIHAKNQGNALRIMYPARNLFSTLPKGFRADSPVRTHTVKTLRPDRLIPAQQPVLDLSGATVRRVRFDSGNNKFESVMIYYRPKTQNGRTVSLRFPPGSRGVFYFTGELQLRFRLCKSSGEFDEGTDLQRPDGLPWSITSARMESNPTRYKPILAILNRENSLQADPCRDRTRIMSTFSPKRLMSSSHRIIDISGLTTAHILANATTARVSLGYYSTQGSRVPYPPGTKGIFYYRQSKSFPTQIGELRFRLCSDSYAFTRGTDLCLPSGHPWHINSQQLEVLGKYRHLHDALVDEQLLDDGIYPKALDAALSSGFTYVSKLGQPFVLDLSYLNFSVSLRAGRSLSHLISIRNFLSNNNSGTAFQGRGIACLREYPSEYMGIRGGRQPLLALEFLEALTPVTPTATCDRMREPVPGELITVSCKQAGGAFMPWGFNPVAKDTRDKVTEWISQQRSES